MREYPTLHLDTN